VVKRTEQKTTIIERFINILIMTNDFKVSAPSLLGASFSVMTSADSEPIVCKVDERGHWSFTVPKDMPARILDKVQDVCEAEFVPSVFARIRADRFFDEALAEGNAKAHKQTLIDRGYLPADEKEQAKLKENHGVTYQSPWE
jgi:hypothetical protein